MLPSSVCRETGAQSCQLGVGGGMPLLVGSYSAASGNFSAVSKPSLEENSRGIQ